MQYRFGTPDAAPAADIQRKAKIFISYSRRDMAFADRLEAALKARGFEPLIDREEIYAFEDWWERIETLIGRADTIVFVLSPDAVSSDVALKEVAHGVALNKRFAPIVARRVEDAAVPEVLRRLNFIFFDDPDRFEASADQLAEALQTDIGWIRGHTEFGEAERQWSAAGGPRGLLLQSPTLELAEHWIASRPHGAPEPTKEIQAFVVASRKGVLDALRFRRRVVASVATLSIGSIFGLLAWINQAAIAEQLRRWALTLPYIRDEAYVRYEVRPHVLSAATEQVLQPGVSFKECSTDCPEMIVLPRGSFTMGSPKNEKDHQSIEEPQHTVAIARPFAVSKYLLTVADWEACVKYGDCAMRASLALAASLGRRWPMDNLTWSDAKTYVSWLNRMTGKAYRLLTEAEYEYATRAGTQTAYPWGNEIGNNHANCNGCGGKWVSTAPVGSFPANGFGLYDMVGNVPAWVTDCWHTDYNGAPTDGSAWIEGGDCRARVTRGSSFVDPPAFLRSASRQHPPIDAIGVGLRVGRTLNAP